MSDLLKRLSVYGVNIPEVMERFVDDTALYESCLASFIDDPAFAALGEALCCKHYPEAFDYAHTLKGVAANLGLKPLYDNICKIVEPLRAAQYDGLTPLYDNIMQARQDLAKLL